MATRSRHIKIEGMDELTQDLEKLRQIPQGKAVQSALIEGAEMLSREARAAAPTAPSATYSAGRRVAPGGLKASFDAKPGRALKNFLQAYSFTWKNRAPHAHLVEFGTKPHSLAPTGKKVMKFAGETFRKKAQHPGAKQNKFFRTAIARTRNRIKKLLEDKVKAAVEALARGA